MRRADTVRQDERQPAGRRLVHDDGPGLALGEEREDVRCDVQLGDPVPVDVSDEREPHAEPRRRRARASPLRAVAGHDEEQSRIAGGSDCLDQGHRAPSPARVARRRARRRRRGSAPSLGPQLLPAAGEPVRARAEVLDVHGVREQVDVLGRGAPRAIIESRASVPVTRTPADRWTTGGTTVPFTDRRHPARGPSS